MTDRASREVTDRASREVTDRAATGGGESPGPEVVTVFRSRLRADAGASYAELAAEMESAARALPGFVDFKTFVAEDGERVSIVVFASHEAHQVWRHDPRHVEAQRRGRDEFYAEFSIRVAETVRTREWAP